MTREQIIEHFPMITAFKDGANIQVKDQGEWRDVAAPRWCTGTSYRIKPEPKLIPFDHKTFADHKDKWIREKGYLRLYKVTSYDNNEVFISNNSMGWVKLLNWYEFEDGSPCGIKINEE